MLVLRRRWWLMRIATAYFLDEADDALPADIAFIFQAKIPLGRSRPFPTLHIDLTCSEDALLDDCSKSNQYKIRRAIRRDNLTFEMLRQPTEQDLSDFVSFYDRFAESKGIPRCYVPELQAIHSADGMRISQVQTSQGRILCQHLYIVDACRSRLRFSASHFREAKCSSERSLISRANRALHWFDITNFKMDNLEIYDFGGFLQNSPDPEVQRINEFKAAFGGYSVVEYHCALGLNFVGRVVLWGRRVLRIGKTFG